MEELLRSEGVTFDKEGNVNMEKHLWIPSTKRMSKNKNMSKSKSKNKSKRLHTSFKPVKKKSK